MPNPDEMLKQFQETEAQAAEFDSTSRTLSHAREEAQRKAQINELRRLTNLENARQDVLTLLRDTVPLVGVPEVVVEKGLARRRPKQIWGLMLSDMQLGQKTTFGDSGDMFEQTSEVCQEQVMKLWSKICELHDISKGSVDVEEFVIMNLGDNHDGDSMRVSQAMKVDQPVAKQFVQVFDLESWLYLQALTRFKKVSSYRVGGNHDRFSAKAGSAGLDELSYVNTYSWIGGEMLIRMHSQAIKEGRLSIANSESFWGATIIANQRVVYEHGASFKASVGSYGGVSYYSIANAAAKYIQMLDGADLIMMGHFHTPMKLPIRGGWGWQLMNGAFPPSSDFIQSNFKGFGRPQQTLFKLHPDYGLIGDEPIYLDTPHMLKPGQFWANKRQELNER